MRVSVDTSVLQPFVKPFEVNQIFPQIELAHTQLHEGSGAGQEFTGWLNLPQNYDKEEFARIQKASEKIKQDSEVLVVIGIGGSYLGARAVIEAVQGAQYNLLAKDTPQILFAGNSVSPSALSDVIRACEGRDFSVNVISKSGTTTEPAVAFRIFRKMLEDRYGKEGAKGRIYATTDKEKGTLKALASKEGYEAFVVPDNVGGRFSVLTAVGLLPVAVAGVDIEALMQGAQDAMQELSVCDENNPCYRYAALRNLLYRKGKTVEVMACYEPDFAMMNEWYKQLYGESEGKEQKGIFPASVIFSTDLHSMGQYLQDGGRFLFETVVNIKNPRTDILVPALGSDADGLGFLENKGLGFVNHKAMQGTALAHTDGGVPVIFLDVEDLSARSLGYLIYFYEKACAVSGYLLGVNPFDQPGVESYKKNMFALLGKPGFEEQRKVLEAQLGL